jgi:1-acyl-sn-glycerol-3-phosphate acyltransferase
MKITDLKHDSGVGRFIWIYLWTPIVLLAAFVPLLIVNGLQLFSLLIRPFSIDWYRKYNRAMAYFIWGGWAFCTMHLIGVKVVFTGDDVPKQEKAIVICNHQGMADILFLICFALTKDCSSHIKWMLKDVLKYVPGVGWGMLFLESIFLKRNWADDSDKIKQTFSNIVDGNLPIWMLSFPEGTRIKPAKKAANDAFAKEKGLKPTQHVLFPRTKGFAAAIEGLRGHVQALYSVTIGYHGKVPGLVAAIRGDVPIVHMHIERFPIEEIPEDPLAQSQWLMDEFYKKDRLLDQFYQKKQFQS